MKICPRCNIEKARVDFADAPPSRKGRDGLKAYCRTCEKELNRERRLSEENLRDIQHRTAHLQAMWGKRQRCLNKGRKK